MPSATEIASFNTFLAQSQNIVIVTHHNPDGDALGSSLGLLHLFEKMGKTANVILPNETPSYLAWMPNAGSAVDFNQNQPLAQQLFNNCQTVVMVDFNTPKRVKEMETMLTNCKAHKVMIDHHPFPDTSSAHLIISDTTVSSTCELAYNVVVQAGLGTLMDEDAATCFYTGIITDTGTLSHNSSRPETYQAVAELMRHNINKDLIHQYLFHSNSYSRMRLLGYMLCEKMKLVPHLRTAFIILSNNELEQFNHQAGDTEGFVNYPLGIEGIDISGFFMERDGKVKISLRSRGNYAVNKLSEKHFNGGGHLNAAGGETDLTLEQAVEVFIGAVPEMLSSNTNEPS
jgi:bifunctional oligoribonuclease and PAP phosphatase NrnA